MRAGWARSPTPRDLMRPFPAEPMRMCRSRRGSTSGDDDPSAVERINACFSSNLITCIMCVTGQSRGPFNRKANAAFPSLPVGTGWLPVENRRAPVVIPATNMASSIKIIVEVGGGARRCHRVCLSRNSQSRSSMSHPSTQPSRLSKHGSDSRRSVMACHRNLHKTSAVSRADPIQAAWSDSGCDPGRAFDLRDPGTKATPQSFKPSPFTLSCRVALPN
jgi:hypothetical protein